MYTIHDLARLLIASWVLSGESSDTSIPTSDGILDHALKRAIDAGAFPAWAKQMLHFVESQVGLQCIELETVLDGAQRAGFTSAPNPSYRRAHVQATPRVARWILSRMSVSEQDAVQWGCILRGAVAESKASFEEYEPLMQVEGSA